MFYQPANDVIRSILISVFLPLLVSTAALSPVALASDSTVSSNIGFVLYTKSNAPGTLNAQWMYGEQYRGPGIATGGPREGFAGVYNVRYFFEDGTFSDEYDLVIAKTGDIYQASWLVEGKVKALGVGMEVENGLAIGWHRTNIE